MDIELQIKTGWSFEAYIRRAEALGVSYIQYRDKINSDHDKLKNLQILRHLWDKVLLINDSVALAHYCDGVHLGQEDLSAIDPNHKIALSRIGEKIGQKIIGISTHNKNEILAANLLDVDYIGLGAYRNSATKDVHNILGKEMDKVAAFSQKPVAAIGGVRKDDSFENIDYLVIGSDFYAD